MRSFIIQNKKDLKQYLAKANKLIGVEFPEDYFNQGFVRAIKDKDSKIIGGYALILNAPYRTLDSLPDDFDHNLLENDLFEITALWVDPKIKNGFASCFLWALLSKDVLMLKNKKSCIYAYDIHKKKLNTLYGLNKPTEIYRGKVKQLEGNESEGEEIIEIVSRYLIGISPLVNLPSFMAKLILKRKTISFKPNTIMKTLKWSKSNGI